MPIDGRSRTHVLRLGLVVVLALLPAAGCGGSGGGGATIGASTAPPGPPAPPQAYGSYDIVYVRQPRYGDTTETTWPEVFHPARIEPGADLMLLHPDGSEEVLVAGGNGAVTDPFVSFDARCVY